jgi:dipeptidyl aminopeptidase/acylaminoacyl peptidase
LFVWNSVDGSTTQITNFVKGKKRPSKKQSEQEQWLNDDQLQYFEIVKHRKDISDIRKDQREDLRPQRPTAIYYGSKSVSNHRLTPDMKFVTYRFIKRAKIKRTKVPDFVTESGYLRDLMSRPKVGSPLDQYQLGIYNIEKDTAYMVNIKQIPGIYDKPVFLKEYHNDTSAYNPKYKKPREVIIHGPVFNDEGIAIVDIKAQDNKDRWIMELDLHTGELTLLDRQHDDAWIGGPGIVGWNMVPGNIGWIDNERFYFQSEKTGYSHLYCMNIKSGKIKQLTKGEFEIIEANLSNDKKHFYITSNKENPHEHHFYKMKADGGKMQKITSEVGNHQVTMSPDEKYLAIRYSYSNKPWELYVMENKAGAERKQLTKSTTKDFESYSWRVPEIIRFTAEDGAKVPARLYRPKNAKKGDPAVIFVHGAGYLQNVHNWWSSYYREYMFHNILVDNGYTVIDIDYRASNGYGRDWRTGIYRWMGGKDLSDQVDGAKYLVEELGIDKDKIGIYGGSYGGFITLMALFTEPGVFNSGAALRSVTDWAHYNHPYTSNILNTPVQDSIAYRKSSPIYHAEGLKDNLLILHGMIDTNVQFQDVVRLAQRLIELEKDNWEFAVFPMERHGFVEPSSWSDEYKRIFKLFQENLK